MGRKYRIVVLPGDGIGRETVPEALKALKAMEEVSSGLNLEFLEFPAGAEYYSRTGEEWPKEAFKTIKEEADAVLLGAVGWNTPTGEAIQLKDGRFAGAGVLFGLRFGLDLYANIRPVKLYQGLPSVIADKGPKDIDMVIVRENTEGLYQPIRGYLARGGVEEMAIDSRVITRKGSERIIRHAFQLSRFRGKGAPKDGRLKVTCVDKSNVLLGCVLFRKVYDMVAGDYPDVNRDYAYIDAFCQWLIRSPEWFDVAVTTNMFGDISTDLGAAVAGGMGMAPAGNIGDEHAMFEPIHGSAPRHAGKNEANPLATILASKMMLEWLGRKHSDDACARGAEKIEESVMKLLSEGRTRTYDLCRGPYANVKPSSTKAVGDAVTKLIKS